MGLFFKTPVQKVQKMYQRKGYRNIPYVSEENAQFIVEHMGEGFNLLVPKEYMNNMNVDNHKVLRGHIVLLWWLNNPRTRKNKIPQYFEKDYGIDAANEIKTLKNYGWIGDDNKATDKGKQILDDYDEIIKQHRSNKIINDDGTVSYDMTKILKGKAKEDESIRVLMEQLNNQINSAEQNGCLLEWLTCEDDKTCNVCKAIADKDNGHGKGIYTPTEARKVIKKLHLGCRCTWLPYIKD